MNKNDLRIMKTEKAIRKAFHQLLQEKPVNKITVKELSELAEINKTTFYSHYDTIFNLIETLENETVDYIVENIRDFKRLFNDTDRFIDDLYEVLLDCGADDIILLNGESKYFSDRIKGEIMKDIGVEMMEKIDDRKYRTIALFVFNGLLGLIKNSETVQKEDLSYIKDFVSGKYHEVG
ncbi:MAG: hypothetical protein PHC41_12935 [Lachnospiraceae bacterium]|nr:hypothetical protein [Lachnospiraceae bacterium]MDD3617112.1 hypothetical protein [Lachnospiraceae bacterium]